MLPPRPRTPTYPRLAEPHHFNQLYITDLHLTDHPDHEYRWRVFEFAHTVMDQHGILKLHILGDVFDKKDRHPARLINRLVDELTGFEEVLILKGNHDYQQEKQPFLAFLNELPTVTFISEPAWWGDALYLPHTPNPLAAWERRELRKARWIFMHQCVIGALVSNYNEMREGLDLDVFRDCPARIFSGDIHVPQEVTRSGVTVTYIGTQHPVSFGDVYQPRCMLLQGTDVTFVDIHTTRRPHIQVATIEELEHVGERDQLGPDDHAIVTLWLEPEHMHDWPALKQAVLDWAARRGVKLHDLRLRKTNDDDPRGPLPRHHATRLLTDPAAALQHYGQRERVGEEVMKVGKEILDDYQRTRP